MESNLKFRDEDEFRMMMRYLCETYIPEVQYVAYANVAGLERLNSSHYALCFDSQEIDYLMLDFEKTNKTDFRNELAADIKALLKGLESSEGREIVNLGVAYYDPVEKRIKLIVRFAYENKYVICNKVGLFIYNKTGDLIKYVLWHDPNNPDLKYIGIRQNTEEEDTDMKLDLSFQENREKAAIEVVTKSIKDIPKITLVPFRCTVNNYTDIEYAISDKSEVHNDIVEILRIQVSDFLGIATYSYPEKIFADALKEAEEKANNRIVNIACYVARNDEFIVYGRLAFDNETSSGRVILTQDYFCIYDKLGRILRRIIFKEAKENGFKFTDYLQSNIQFHLVVEPQKREKQDRELWSESDIISLQETRVINSYMLKWDKVVYIKPPFKHIPPVYLGGVGYFRLPNFNGNETPCPICGKPFHEHGYLDRNDIPVKQNSSIPEEIGNKFPEVDWSKTVCPGDYLWFILDEDGNEKEIRIMDPKTDKIPDKCEVLFR